MKSSTCEADICDAQAALDDVGNWIVSTLLELDVPYSAGVFVTEVRS